MPFLLNMYFNRFIRNNLITRLQPNKSIELPQVRIVMILCIIIALDQNDQDSLLYSMLSQSL
jgi:hypothetical protein